MKIEMEAVGDFPDFKAMLDAFPELSARILGYVGKQAAMQLYEEHLQGQDITFHNVTRSASGSPLGRSGRRLVTYSVGRGLKWVSVSSFPLNLYENRKQLRRGDAERRNILRKKLASGVSHRVTSYIADAEKLIVDDWFNDRKKKDRGYTVGALNKL